jgi:hypothetical protein
VLSRAAQRSCAQLDSHSSPSRHDATLFYKGNTT